jgi:chromosome segregation ATPase
MRLDIHHTHHGDPQLQQRLDWLYSQLERLHQQSARILSNQESHMATVKQLVDDVAQVRGQANSIGMLITQLREQITGLTNGNLPPDVQAQVDQAFADAEAAKADLAKAITSNPDSGSTGNASAADTDAPTIARPSAPDAPIPFSAPPQS